MYPAYISSLPQQLEKVKSLRAELAQLCPPAVVTSILSLSFRNGEAIVRSTNPEIVKKLTPLKILHKKVEIHSESHWERQITADKLRREAEKQKIKEMEKRYEKIIENIKKKAEQKAEKTENTGNQRITDGNNEEKNIVEVKKWKKRESQRRKKI